mgnify:CR=1 FL=1
MNTNLLAQIPFFTSLPAEELDRLMSELEVLNLASGSQFSAKQSLTLWELGGTLGPVGQGQTLQITLDGEVFSSASTGLAFVRNTCTGLQVLTTPAAVPEPTSLALLLAGMVGATLARRRAINRSAR